MSKQTITIIVGVFILVVIGMFVFAYLQRPDEQPMVEDTQNEEPAEGPYDYIERIDAKHFFIDGLHTLVGEIIMPTPCDLLTWDSRIAESFPEQVTVDFSVTNNADTCAQMLTPQRFKVEFAASENAAINARLEGRDIELNLIPPEEGETPDNFELFIKG